MLLSAGNVIGWRSVCFNNDSIKNNHDVCTEVIVPTSFPARILSFNPSPNRSLPVKFSVRDLWPLWTTEESWVTNWVLPEVLCASEYSSRPWFCEFRCLLVFFFFFLQSYKVQALSTKSVHMEEVTSQSPAPPFFVYQLSTMIMPTETVELPSTILYLRDGLLFKASLCSCSRSASPVSSLMLQVSSL